MKKTLRISHTINPFLSNYAHEIICFDFTSTLEEIKTHFSVNFTKISKCLGRKP